MPDPMITTFTLSLPPKPAFLSEIRPRSPSARLEFVRVWRTIGSRGEEKRMRIRKATMEDREGVIGLLRTLLIPAGEVPENWRDAAQIFRLLVENPELGTILVAEENGEIAGITTLSYPTALRCCGAYSCIEENIVDERFRGRGIGGALLEAAIAEATARGCDELQVNAPSEKGYPLYLRHGFKDHGKVQVKADLPLSGR
jgi:GNAT superfamily N-acetyltransferase